MPEVPSSAVALVREGLRYACCRPLIELSAFSGYALNPPLSAGLLLTTRCNLACPFCFLDTSADLDDPFTAAEWVQVIDELADWGVRQLTFNGGEPLLHPHLFELIRHAHERGFTTGFTTNGTLLDAAAERVRESGVDRISVSIDGIGKTHDSLRGRGVFAKALAGLRRLTAVPGLKLRINTIVFNDNVEELPAIYELARDHGAELVLMPFTTEHMTAVRRRGIPPEERLRLQVGEDKLPRLREILTELRRKKRREGVLLNPDSFIDVLIATSGGPAVDGGRSSLTGGRPAPSARKCRIAGYNLGVTAAGDVVVCGGLGVLGNARTASLRSIWNSPAFRAARKRMRTCGKCALNCHYTPSAWDLIKDFGVYPLTRRIAGGKPPASTAAAQSVPCPPAHGGKRGAVT